MSRTPEDTWEEEEEEEEAEGNKGEDEKRVRES